MYEYHYPCIQYVPKSFYLKMSTSGLTDTDDKSPVNGGYTVIKDLMDYRPTKVI